MDLTDRALRAYFRSGGFAQPKGGDATVAHNGKLYVVLENVNGFLAVYRVRTNGALKRLHCWPAAIG